jgi:hypothetical protein
VLVVVDVMAGVPMGAVHVVDVVAMRDGGMTAPVRVDVHVPGVRQVVPAEVDGAGIDVVGVDVVNMPIVEEVHVIVVGHGRVPAVPVVAVGMLLWRQGGVGHGIGHGSPNGPHRQTMVPD